MNRVQLSKEEFLIDLSNIRNNSPLVHNITNFVVMNNTANALLAIGASPVMAHAKEEVEEMVNIASSLVINIGTLSPGWVEAMILAGKRANERGIPVVFDPVGAGATSYRTDVCKKIIEQCRPTVIRGNASEIMALVNSSITTKGVDSSATSNEALEYAKLLAQTTGAVVTISGPIDYITNGVDVAEVTFGSTKMAIVTGLGCTATALTGAFVGVNSNDFMAAAHAMVLMGAAGQLAAEYSKGNGSLQINFLDELCNFTEASYSRLSSI